MNSTEKYMVKRYNLVRGKSSRVGVDKGTVILNRKSIVQQTVETKAVIGLNNTTYEKYGLEVNHDWIIDIGPAGGIYTSVNHPDLQQKYIVSCDIPFVNKDAIKFIIVNSNQ